MQSRTIHLLKITVACLCVLVVLILGTVVGSFSSVPELRSVEYLNNRPFLLSDFTSQPVLISFFSPTCLSCEDDLETLRVLHDQYASFGVGFVTVLTPEFVTPESLDYSRTWPVLHNVSWPVVLDSSHATWDAFAGWRWPRTILLDKTNTILYDSDGVIDYAVLERYLQASLGSPELESSLLTLVQPVATSHVYFGLAFADKSRFSNVDFIPGLSTARFFLPSERSVNNVYLDGLFTFQNDFIRTPDGEGTIHMTYLSRRVYLVAGGKGTVEFGLDNDVRSSLALDTFGLYPLSLADSPELHSLTVQPDSGVRVYGLFFD